jgi:biotin operon repressor
MTISLNLPDGTSSLVIKGEIPARTAALIDRIADMDDAFQVIGRRADKASLLNAAEAYELAGMKYIAAKLRNRAGIRDNSRQWNNVVPDDAKAKALALIVENNGAIRADELAGMLGISRSSTDKLTKQLRLDGRIVLVNKAFYKTVEAE